MKAKRLCLDTISNLPPPIIETILCLLPIQGAVRTSILSREWRYKWIKIPKLVFIENTFVIENEEKWNTRRFKLFNAIYQVLLQHEGPIHEFTLHLDTYDTCVEIDLIVFHLSRKNTIRKLKLEVDWGYKLPSCLFSLHQLTDLHLKRCDLGDQLTCKGFQSLTSLHLKSVSISENMLLHLLSNCPLLKSVTLSDIIVRGLDSTPIAKLFDCLPGAEYLCVSFWMIEYFVRGVQQVLPTTLLHLKYLYFDRMSFNKKHGSSFLALLIRSSPNLEKVKLKIYDELELSPDRVPTLEDYSEIWFEHLNELEIIDLVNEKIEFDFVKLVLAKSPVLKKVKMHFWWKVNEVEKLQFSEILLASPHESPVVEIIINHSFSFKLL